MGVVYIVGGQEGGQFLGKPFLVLGQYIFLSQTINFQYCNYDCDFPMDALSVSRRRKRRVKKGRGRVSNPYTPLEPGG